MLTQYNEKTYARGTSNILILLVPRANLCIKSFSGNILSNKKEKSVEKKFEFDIIKIKEKYTYKYEEEQYGKR